MNPYSLLIPSILGYLVQLNLLNSSNYILVAYTGQRPPSIVHSEIAIQYMHLQGEIVEGTLMVQVGSHGGK